MEAKDTVNQFIKLNIHVLLYDEIERIKQEQAAISFRAGKQEVVDWIKEHGRGEAWIDSGEFSQGIISKYCFSETTWYEKLKEWGVKW
jgi:hypothetical protein